MLKSNEALGFAPQSLIGQGSEIDFCANKIRRIVVDLSKQANVGHIGSALSVSDLLAGLFCGTLNIPELESPVRDRFVLSKGHAALALYACLYLRGWISEDVLKTFGTDGTLLGVHPEHRLPGIDFSTGSLGQGLSIAAGAALAARVQKLDYRVFALLSDAECNEGAVWESIMFAAHHKLSNLIVIIDLNGQQAFGHTQEVLDISPMTRRWEAFGWDVQEIDGHNGELLAETINRLDTKSGPPHVIVAKTIFGKGVSYMENKIKWHYSPMSDAEYEIAIQELEAAK